MENKFEAQHLRTVIEACGEKIDTLNFKIEGLRLQLKEMEASRDMWQKKALRNVEMEEEAENLRAKVLELEERNYVLAEQLAKALGDNEGPMPMREEFPKAGDVTEVVNVTKVIEGVVE